MDEAKMFHLLWKRFTEARVIQENREGNHKVLYQRPDGWWALRYAQGGIYLCKPTLEELMIEVIAGAGVTEAMYAALADKEGK